MPYTQENESNASPQMESKKFHGNRGSFQITPLPDDQNTTDKKDMQKRGSMQMTAITPQPTNGSMKRDTTSSKTRQSVTMKTEEGDVKKEDEITPENAIP